MRVVLVLVCGAVLVGGGAALASHVTQVPPATVPVGFLAAHNRIADVPVNSLARSVKPDGVEAYVQHVRLGANASTPWHTHPGTAFVTVVDGALTYQFAHANECHSTTYTPGNGFVDPGHGHVHRAIAGPAGADFYVTYLLIPGSPNHLITAGITAPEECS
jgi:quercetin dioxygenase-like cupin family protein